MTGHLVSSHPILEFGARLLKGPTAFSAWCSARDPANVESLLAEGYDCVILDWQHGFHDSASIIGCIAAATALGKPALVRIGIGQFAEAARFFDWGAAGIVAPMINCVEDARAFVDFVKYPPLGARSWGPIRALGMTGLAPVDYLHGANGFSLAIAMIETRAALDSLDAILAVEGLDGVLVGPSDLSITLTSGKTVNPAEESVDRALDHILARTREAGKIACAFCMDGARAAELAARGYHLTSIATDQILLRSAGRTELAKARGGG